MIATVRDIVAVAVAVAVVVVIAWTVGSNVPMVRICLDKTQLIIHDGMVGSLGNIKPQTGVIFVGLVNSHPTHMFEKIFDDFDGFLLLCEPCVEAVGKFPLLSEFCGQVLELLVLGLQLLREQCVFVNDFCYQEVCVI